MDQQRWSCLSVMNKCVVLEGNVESAQSDSRGKSFSRTFDRERCRVNSRLSGCAAKTIKILPTPRLPPPPRQPHQILLITCLPFQPLTPPTCDTQDLREFTCKSNKHLAFRSSELVMTWLRPCWPYYKSVSDTVHMVERGEGGGVDWEKKMGRLQVLCQADTGAEMWLMA